MYVRQPTPKGDGAVLHAKQAVEGEAFAIMFGDDIVDSEIPALKQLMNVLKKCAGGHALSSKEKRVSSYGIAAGSKHSEGVFLLNELVEKQVQSGTFESRNWKVHRHAGILQILLSKAGKDGELRLIDGFARGSNWGVRSASSFKASATTPETSSGCSKPR